MTLDTAAYGSTATINGHDTDAIYFILKAVNTISDMLGIEPWSIS